ncbi:MAG: uncharacterized protein A8A55_3080 [Amphiamblys sp. WSBS2006]|nr:MAG: uncharacterized protein A8A55_3080 [Amphiamblys sp. WSBS2006]
MPYTVGASTGHMERVYLETETVEEIYPVGKEVARRCPACLHKGKKTVVEKEADRRYQTDPVDLTVYEDRNGGYCWMPFYNKHGMAHYGMRKPKTQGRRPSEESPPARM